MLFATMVMRRLSWLVRITSYNVCYTKLLRGKSKIEKKVLKALKPGKAELQIIHMHPKFGVEIAVKAGGFPEPALRIIFQHHERMDGTGYPMRLQGPKITVPARIAAIADLYDNMVNNPDQSRAVTPYQAMSRITSYNVCYTKLLRVPDPPPCRR